MVSCALILDGTMLEAGQLSIFLANGQGNKIETAHLQVF